MYAAKNPISQKVIRQIDRAKSPSHVDLALWELAYELPEPLTQTDFQCAQRHGWNGNDDRLVPQLRLKILEAAFRQDLLFADRRVPFQKPLVSIVYGKDQLQKWYRESKQRFPEFELTIALRPSYSRTEKFIEQTLYWQPLPGSPPLIANLDFPVAPYWERCETLATPELWWDEAYPNSSYVVDPRASQSHSHWQLDLVEIEAIRWSGRFEVLGSQIQSKISATGQRLLPDRILFCEDCYNYGNRAVSFGCSY
ncbi:MAG: hypothetical protein WBC69_18505 [Geitlerinemataceae cyanobacterium]